MVSCKDKIITFPLFNTCYPQNLARNLARFFFRIEVTNCDLKIEIQIWAVESFNHCE